MGLLILLIQIMAIKFDKYRIVIVTAVNNANDGM